MSCVKEETIKGAKWGFIRKLTVQPVQMLFGMVLARLITPTEMGILGLTAIFFSVASTLADSGFGSALVRKLDRSEEDINTMFWFNLVMSALLGVALYLSAPCFAAFYNQPELLWLTRVSAILLFLTGSSSVHLTLFQCKRDFKTPAIIGLISSFVGMPVCLLLAWQGWALCGNEQWSADFAGVR